MRRSVLMSKHLPRVVDQCHPCSQNWSTSAAESHLQTHAWTESSFTVVKVDTILSPETVKDRVSLIYPKSLSADNIN